MQKTLYLFVIAVLMVACQQNNTESHFIQDKKYREDITKAFEDVHQKIGKEMPEAFKWLNDTGVTAQEREAMQFLYVSMPLSDIVNRDADFYLQQVRAAFKTKELFIWAKTLPEDVFRHFVLPYRINNENMDEARMVFQKELYPRIKDMSMEQAALEVNHWCHEKVNYRATDIRTISPLNAIKTAYGRCGEESTFTVTALRAVGIPARQVYTPRWAHTDDNHAWVEAYVDGKWQYFGACEPKSVLNTAWFDEPVLRAMMVHTKAFGKYYGNEAVIQAKDNYSILHLLSNYVPVKELFVKVVDKEGKAVKEADVSFGLYNYAEFYPLKKAETDDSGMASLVSGYGTLRVMASDQEGYFNSMMVNLKDTDTCTLILDKHIGKPYTERIVHVPPVQKLPKQVSTDQETANNIRLAQEDSIRNAYIATFYTPEKATAFLKTLGIKDQEVTDILVESRGNYLAIESYLSQTVNTEKALDLLKSLVQKDYHDITTDMLLAHLKTFRQKDKALSADIVNAYILNPRVSSEEISDYRAFLQQHLKAVDKGTVAATSEALQKWIEDNIDMDHTWNYYRIYMHPKGVCTIGRADEHSRNLLYVTAMRALGYPARIEQARNQPQYYDKAWQDVNFAAETVAVPASPKAKLSINYKGNKPKDPLYRIHFGLAKFNGEFFETLEYDWEKPLSQFDKIFEVEAGYYQLISGNRLHDGRVIIEQKYFNIDANQHQTITLNIPDIQLKDDELGVWKAYKADNAKAPYEIIGWIDPKSEPGKHFLADFKAVAKDYAKETVKLYVANQTDKDLLMLDADKSFDIQIDKGYTLLADMYKDLGVEEEYMLPVFVIITPDKVVRLHTKGYNIGTPAQLLKYAHLLVKQ